MSKLRGRPFAPGNTAGRGRPQGSRNKATQESQALFAEYAGPLTKRCIAGALKGEPVPLRLAMDRVCPTQKDRTVEIQLPPVRQVADLSAAAQAITEAVGKGEVTPEEGQKAMGMLHQHCDILMKTDLGSRLRALEEIVAGDRQNLKGFGKEEPPPDSGGEP
jgi:hypothetical protein